MNPTLVITSPIFDDLIYLVIRQPPGSTLFPYNDALPISRQVDAGGGAERQRGHGARPAGGPRVCPGGRRRGPGGDRKSTRLNSSHMSISYAVFCLKKKRTAYLDQQSVI